MAGQIAPASPPAASGTPPAPWWLLAARPKTLGAAAAPVLVGTALALEAGAFHLLAALVALVSAVLIQVGTNYVNDVADFERGADTDARQGPARAVANGWTSSGTMKRAAAAAFGLAFAVGLYLVGRGGWPILVVGVVGILSGVAYTYGRYALAYTGLADLFVLVFFGPVAVAGTAWVQAVGSPEADALIRLAAFAGLGPGLLSVAILLANNVRDVEEDRAAGKKTLVVRLGRAFGVGAYAGCVLGAALVPLALWLRTGERPGALAAVLACALLAPAVRTLHTQRGGAALGPVLGRTAQGLVLWAVLFSLGWVLT